MGQTGGTVVAEAEGRKTEQAGAGRPGAEGPQLAIQPPRGTHDILPAESPSWQLLESAARRLFQVSNYQEVRVPIFEHTELFKRGVGETTDIVNKEMYTFSDRSDRSLTLRPEGTAGVVRAYLHGGLHRMSPPVKLWYAGPMFRYESTKTGRQRQFNQTGVEAFGSAGPLIDAEVIVIALRYLQEVGAESCTLQLNSIGCPLCRPAYRELLKARLAPRLPELCGDCQDRFQRNPLRMLDCKIRHDQERYLDVPLAVDHLCQECSDHFQQLKDLLDRQGARYVLNPRLVRGLDYYTRTVFEVVSSDHRLGVESTVCAGGRYDNLVELFGGPPTPAVGWALGMERLILLLGEKRVPAPEAFIVSANQAEALRLACELRATGIACDLDFPSRGQARSFGKQLQQANRSAARWAVILGDDELAAGEVTLKNMKTGSQQRVPRRDLAVSLKDRPAGQAPAEERPDNEPETRTS